MRETKYMHNLSHYFISIKLSSTCFKRVTVYRQGFIFVQSARKLFLYKQHTVFYRAENACM